jgi:hypothetical protein
MSSAAAQAKAQQLNVKMETEARTILDGIEKQWLRKVARSSYTCVVACFDKAGSAGPSEVLDQCSRNCQVNYQNANAIMQHVSSCGLSVFLGIMHILIMIKPGDGSISESSESGHDGLPRSSPRYDQTRL